MLTPLGQITHVCIRTFSLSDKYHYFAAVISRYAEISFPFNQSYIQCFQKFTKSVPKKPRRLHNDDDGDDNYAYYYDEDDDEMLILFPLLVPKCWD